MRRHRTFCPQLEALESRSLLSTLTVLNTFDSGPGSLRQAILDANLLPGQDTIAFNIAGSGVRSIRPISALPAITDSVILDATTQSGFAGSPLIELDGTGAGADIDGLQLIAANSLIRGLVINRFGGSGIEVNGAANRIEGNFIGTDATGTLDLGNALDGITLQAGSGNLIGGTTPAARNIISGNDRNGIYMFDFAPANLVQGNYIGTNAAGTAALGNRFGAGVAINSAANTIGGTAPGAGNLISGNAYFGIFISGFSDPDVAVLISFGGHATNANGNIVQGNRVGTNAAGTAAIPNDQAIYLGFVHDTIIGGTEPGARNVVSGNWNSGIRADGCNRTIVQGNYIGTDITGTAKLGNGYGVELYGSNFSTIGGTEPSARNIISNNYTGVIISGGLSLIFVSQTPDSSTGNLVQGNYIGTDFTGTVAMGNRGYGIEIGRYDYPASENTIGGQVPGAGNLIAYNASSGIAVIAGDYSLVPNPGEPITFIIQKPIVRATGNSFVSNSIHSNGGLGIDLGGNGLTANDSLDLDEGANFRQNFPVLALQRNADGTTTVNGTLHSTPGTVFRIELFASPAADSSGYGEGQFLVGSLVAATDANGNASFSTTLASPLPGPFISATATDPLGNTSEFSSAVALLPGLGITDTSVLEGSSGTKTVVFTVTLSYASAQTVTVQYATANFTASAGSDFTAVSGTLTFNPGETTKTISVVVSGDTIFEPTEMFHVNLSNAAGAYIADGQGEGTITNDDSQPRMSISDVSLKEGRQGQVAFVFTISLTNASYQTITVDFTTTDGTAQAGSDYTAISGTLEFFPGQTTKTLTVWVNSDKFKEPDELFYLDLSDLTNATFTKSRGQGTIRNDDR